MIEVVSSPKDLSTWDSEEQPFYLEVFGDPSPVLDTDYAEIVPPGSDGVTSAASTPVYEYWWTIGHPGHKRQHHHLLSGTADNSLWGNLAEEAAHIYLMFPLDAGWRVKEIVATVKYLSPVHNQESLSERAAAEWQHIQPLLADASSIASTLSAVPPAAPFAAGAAPILATLSRLQFGSVPTGKGGYDWYVEKVSTGYSKARGVMQGVMWTLPRDMFEDLGSRITGSLAVSFVPNRRQDIDEEWEPRPGALRAHAVVFPKDGEPVWNPSQSSFLEFHVTPRQPSEGGGAEPKS
jgi:hypothetical protein